jgi:glutathione-regulated potassium-efflux system protein KefB
MEAFLISAFVYLVAAVILVPLANRFGLGSVLGYLIAGVFIGPILGWGEGDNASLQHFAEFGVVMMLFLIGLELDPKQLWSLRKRLLGLGGLQVVLSTIAIFLFVSTFSDRWQSSVAVGLILALSSTAIVMQTLSEKGLTRTEGGRASFLVLLFQDVAVIPILALLPLLSLHGQTRLPNGIPANSGLSGAADTHAPEVAAEGAEMVHAATSFIESLPGWAGTLVVLAAVAIVVLGGHYLTRPVFRYIANARNREIFVAAALLLVIGIALLMTLVGISPALGTFLAGVVLANSEYRHELESDIEPFKGLLLGLFFITVGAGIEFEILFANFFWILFLTVALMLMKGAVLFGIARLFGLFGRDGWLFTLSLAQAGEFGFVLTSFSLNNGVIREATGQTLQLVIALSMLATPLLFIAYDKLVYPLYGEKERAPDEITEKGSIIIAGLGRFGQIVNRMLLREGYKTVVLDYHNETVEGLRKFGMTSYFGDPTRPELLESAGIKDAKVLVVALDDRERSLHLVSYVRREHPHVTIIARAHDRVHTYELYAAGARQIIRETFDSSVRAGKYALEALGHHPFEVEKKARSFVDEDQKNLRTLAELWEPGVDVFDNSAYLERAREQLALQERAAHAQRRERHDRSHRSWMPPPKGGTVSDEEED